MNIRITLAGGGTGGHLYPLLAVADALRSAAGSDTRIAYVGPAHAIMHEFEARNIAIHTIASSKLRRYAALGNIIDAPKFLWSIVQALAILYDEMPDVVFSKGGPGSLPVVLAAAWYRIPVVIHESDTTPGLANTLSAKFAARILLAFKEAMTYFPQKKTRVVGNPVREIFSVRAGDSKLAKQQFKFDPEQALVLILGGSQGSQRVNSFILDNLDQFLPEFQIAHQTGENNFAEVQEGARAALQTMSETVRSRYHAFSYLAADQMKALFDAADVVVARAGSGTIFEIAAAGKPAILIPLSDAARDHQRTNAYAYAATGAATVVEEANFTAHLILSLVHSIMNDEKVRMNTKTAAGAFFKPNAAKDIALEVLSAIK